MTILINFAGLLALLGVTAWVGWRLAQYSRGQR